MAPAERRLLVNQIIIMNALARILADIRRIADRLGGFSVPLWRTATKIDRRPAVPAAKSSGLPPQRASGVTPTLGSQSTVHSDLQR